MLLLIVVVVVEALGCTMVRVDLTSNPSTMVRVTLEGEGAVLGDVPAGVGAWGLSLARGT